MAAPALDVDREAVKAFAILNGVREAARQFGLSENTVSSWSVRYGWFPKVESISLPPTMKPIASNARKPSEVARNLMDELGERTRLGFAKGLAKGAETVAEMEGEEIIQIAPNIASLTKAAGVVHGWKDGSGGGQTLIQVNVGESFDGPSRDV